MAWIYLHVCYRRGLLTRTVFPQATWPVSKCHLIHPNRYAIGTLPRLNVEFTFPRPSPFGSPAHAVVASSLTRYHPSPESPIVGLLGSVVANVCPIPCSRWRHQRWRGHNSLGGVFSNTTSTQYSSTSCSSM